MVVADGIAVGIIGSRPLEDDVGAVGLAAIGRVDRGRRGLRRPRSRPLHPLVRDAHLAVPRGLVGIGETVLAHDHLRQRQGGHLHVVDDRQAAEPGRSFQLALELVLVAGRPDDREELVEVVFHGLPCLAVRGDEELGIHAFGLDPASHKHVRAAQGPDDRALPALLGGQAVGAGGNVLHGGGPLAPGLLREVRTILP